MHRSSPTGNTGSTNDMRGVGMSGWQDKCSVETLLKCIILAISFGDSSGTEITYFGLKVIPSLWMWYLNFLTLLSCDVHNTLNMHYFIVRATVEGKISSEFLGELSL